MYPRSPPGNHGYRTKHSVIPQSFRLRENACNSVGFCSAGHQARSPYSHAAMQRCESYLALQYPRVRPSQRLPSRRDESTGRCLFALLWVRRANRFRQVRRRLEWARLNLTSRRAIHEGFRRPQSGFGSDKVRDCSVSRAIKALQCRGHLRRVGRYSESASAHALSAFRLATKSLNSSMGGFDSPNGVEQSFRRYHLERTALS